nr:hypothetical protein [Deltaproteobacteria bacterium]
DFAKRLSEFVSNAGNTLYKGISEILDRTMSERRERSGEVGALKTATAHHSLQIIATRGALTHLREGLWSTELPEDEASAAALPADALPTDS